MNSLLGLGNCPIGSSLYGYGSPSTVEVQVGTSLESSIINGRPLDARLIDQGTLDYVFDSNGVLTGQSSTDQRVFLAVKTTLGTAINFNLGSQFGNIKTFDAATIDSQMYNVVYQALSNLIKTKVITLISVQANLNQNGICANVVVNYKNNASNQVTSVSL